MKVLTSEFDCLRSIWSAAQKIEELKPLVLWLADIATAEADAHDPTWSFQKWKAGREGKRGEVLFGIEYIKYGYLDDCHDTLDHAKYPGKVFTPETAALIRIIGNAVGPEKSPVSDLELTHKQAGKSTILKRFPDLLQRLKEAGFSYDETYRQWQLRKWSKCRASEVEQDGGAPCAYLNWRANSQRGCKE